MRSVELVSRTRVLGLGLVCACIGWGLLGQTADKSQESGVFRITSTLIQMDAVVTDKKGHQVTDLTAADFEVKVDGKAHAVTNATYVQVTGHAPPPAYRERSPKNTHDLPMPPAPELRADQVKRTIVLMVDDLGLSWESMAGVRSALAKFVDKQMQPGDMVAICRTGAGSGAIQQFTSDKTMLRSVIEHLRWNPNGNGHIGVFEPIGMVSNLAAGRGAGIDNGMMPSMSTAGRVPIRQDQRASIITELGGTLTALQYIVESLEKMPGRKSVVVFSDGFLLSGDDFDEELERPLHALIDTANRAGTVFYTMEARALQPVQPGAQERIDPGSSQLRNTTPVYQVINQINQSRRELFNASQQGLAYLADKTGGLAYMNGNDLNYGLARVMEDQAGFYLLGFRPDDDTFKEKNGFRHYHRLTVEVKKPGLHVRSRTGFLGETDAQMRRLTVNPAEQIREAMLSPFLSSDIHLEVTPLYAELQGHGPVVRNLLHIDARDVQFVADKDGKSTAKLDVLAVAVGAKDAPLAQVANSYTIVVPNDRVLAVQREGLVYTLDVPVKQPGPYQIRAAVRDEQSQAIGSAHQYIEVPNVKKGRLALTSLVLSGKDAGGENGCLYVAAARRRFHAGAQLRYLSVLEGADAASQHAAIQAQLRLFCENRQVYATPVTLAAVKTGGWALAGTVKLPSNFAAGEYYLQVVVQDDVHGHRMASQWTDFEVIP